MLMYTSNMKDVPVRYEKNANIPSGIAKDGTGFTG